MIDPLLAPPAQRHAPTPRPKRRKRAVPARTSKIITAGASTTALFTMVAAMGWQSGIGSANSPAETVPVPDTTPAAAVVVPVIPVTAPPTTAVPLPIVEPQAAAVPAAAVPVTTAATVPAPVVTPAPKVVVVPRAVPVTLPVQKTVKHKSHTTTKTSG